MERYRAAYFAQEEHVITMDSYEENKILREKSNSVAENKAIE